MPRLQTIAKFAFLFWLTAAVLLSFGCRQKPEYRKIDLSRLEPIKVVPPLESSEVIFRIAIAGVVSPTETLKSYRQLVSYLGQALRQPVEMVQRGTYAEINPWEKEILPLFAQGYTNQQIANQLYLSVKTVETYKVRSWKS